VVFEVDHEEQCMAVFLDGTMKLMATRVEGLSLLACGQAVPNPAEFLNSARFARLLSELAGTYDRVLVDAPPVTVVTDAHILGALCDYTIFVLKADKSTHRAARRALEALESVGAELLGVVVNEVKGNGGRYGYYGRYAGSSSAGSGNGGNNKSRTGNVRPVTHQPVPHGISESKT